MRSQHEERHRILAAAICAWMMSAAVFAAEEGNWTLMPAEEAGKVHFGVFHRHDRGNSHSETDWPVSAFQGLDLATRARHDVKFTIARDAGRFDCDGYLTEGEGAGIFRFTPDAQFARAMSDLGFDGIDEDKQFAMAVHDVTLDFARTMKAEKLSGFDTEKLIAFRIFDVNRNSSARCAPKAWRPRTATADRVPHARRVSQDGARAQEGRESMSTRISSSPSAFMACRRNSSRRSRD